MSLARSLPAAKRRRDVQGQSASNDNLDYERLGRFIYTFHRICGSADKLTDTELATDAPPELAKRAAYLAQKFHHIIENPGSTAESELGSTLHEATEVQRRIDEWRAQGSRR